MSTKEVEMEVDKQELIQRDVNKMSLGELVAHMAELAAVIQRELLSIDNILLGSDRKKLKDQYEQKRRQVVDAINTKSQAPK